MAFAAAAVSPRFFAAALSVAERFGSASTFFDSSTALSSVDFTSSLMPQLAYPYIYAPGTYQNKPNRPGRYLFWITHGLDTTALPNGTYTVEVLAEDNRFNESTQSLDFTVANPGPLTPTYPATRWPHLTME